MKKENERKSLFFILYILALGVFCIASSPLIATKSTDSEVFWLMGRGMASGKVLYKDLFDHKGIYTYFFNALGSYLDSLFQSEIGLFIVETILTVFSEIFLKKTASLFLKSESEQIISAFLGAMLLFNYFTHQGGNMTETYALTFQIISMYYVAKYYFKDIYKKDSNIGFPPHYMFILGICVGICFLLKANYVAMWIPIPFVLGISFLRRKQYRDLCLNLFFGVVGIFVSWMPALFYGALFDCMQDVYFAMIKFNFMYISGEGLNLIGLFLETPENIFIIASAFSIFIVLRNKRKVAFEFKLAIISSFLLSIYFIFSSGRTFGHYYHYFLPYIYPLCIGFVSICYNKIHWFSRYKSFILIGIFCFTVLFNGRFPIKLFLNTDTSRQKEYSQTVEKIVSCIECQDLSNNVLAVGNNVEFYNQMNCIPDIKFFYLPSIDWHIFPDAVRMQEDLIIHAKKEYLIVPVMEKENLNRTREQKVIGLSDEKSYLIEFSLQNNYKELLHIINEKNDDFILYKKVKR